jgi:hypothetical protein
MRWAQFVKDLAGIAAAQHLEHGAIAVGGQLLVTVRLAHR